MRKESLAFLEELLSTPSPSGFETRGQVAWLRYARDFVDEWRTDEYGNTYACLNPGGSPKVMLTGHADEIGFMVSFIDDRGYVYVRNIGGIDTAIIRGKRVTIHAKQGPVRGVMGATAVHLTDPEKAKKPPKLHECFVDVGASSGDEARKRIAIGDAVTFVDDFEILHGDVAVARAFDNRVGTFSAIEALRLLSESKSELAAEVWAVSTVLEEIGAHGGGMAAYSLDPDLCLVVDVTHATDSPGISKEQHGDVRLGGGPTLSFGSANHPVLVRRLLALAERLEMPVQTEVAPRRTGTDLDTIFIQRGGIVGAVIGIPNRYMHTAVEMIRLDDLVATARLLAAFCLDLEPGDAFRVAIDL